MMEHINNLYSEFPCSNISVLLFYIHVEFRPKLRIALNKQAIFFSKAFSYALEKFGDRPCSSLIVLCTLGVHTGGVDTLMPPLGRVDSSEEVLTRTWTVSIGGIIPRLTTNTVLSKSSSITMCPVTTDCKTKQARI